jgi:hypothetical protein
LVLDEGKFAKKYILRTYFDQVRLALLLSACFICIVCLCSLCLLLYLFLKSSLFCSSPLYNSAGADTADAWLCWSTWRSRQSVSPHGRQFRTRHFAGVLFVYQQRPVEMKSERIQSELITVDVIVFCEFRRLSDELAELAVC